MQNNIFTATVQVHDRYMLKASLGSSIKKILVCKIHLLKKQKEWPDPSNFLLHCFTGNSLECFMHKGHLPA